MHQIYGICDVECNFHMLHIILHESDLRYGVTNRHLSPPRVWGLHMNMIKKGSSSGPTALHPLVRLQCKLQVKAQEYTYSFF